MILHMYFSMRDVHTFVQNRFMEHNYPLEYTLDDGIHVVVNKTGTHTFDFTLKPHEGPARHFTLNDSEEFTDEKEKQLDFDQLNALRMFWLKTRDEV